jgi:hypothetical protein
VLAFVGCPHPCKQGRQFPFLLTQNNKGQKRPSTERRIQNQPPEPSALSMISAVVSEEHVGKLPQTAGDLPSAQNALNFGVVGRANSREPVTAEIVGMATAVPCLCDIVRNFPRRRKRYPFQPVPLRASNDQRPHSSDRKSESGI